MSKRKRRTFSKEQKADAVRLVRESGEGIATVARNLDLTENSLRRWVKQADIDDGILFDDLAQHERIGSLPNNGDNNRGQTGRSFLRTIR